MSQELAEKMSKNKENRIIVNTNMFSIKDKIIGFIIIIIGGVLSLFLWLSALQII